MSLAIQKRPYSTQLGDFFILENDRWIGKTIKEGNAWDLNKIQQILTIIPKNKNILDLGANIGTHSIPYAKHLNNDCIVHAFEPQHVIYDILEQNVQLNTIANIKTYNVAVGHTNKITTLSGTISDGENKGQQLLYSINTPTNYGGIQLGIGGEEVKMITIDSLSLENIGFIKMDIEGCEKLAFYGCQETIRSSKPIILYENKKNIPLEIRNGIDHSILNFDIQYFLISLNYRYKLKLINDILYIP